jgi:hypothetical protein
MTSDFVKSLASSSYRQWAVFFLGLSLYLAAQGYLILVPVFSRSEPPQPKDVIPYLVRTERMAKCPWCDCTALKDLSIQFSEPSQSVEATAYRGWAGTVLNSNQLGLSGVLLGMKRLGIGIETGYRVTCVLVVLLFGVGFAYLLSVLWGRTVAGLALLIFGFKVFPDTGLYYVVPSNICMGLALFLLARIVSTKGKALWSLLIGSLILIAIHPIGVAYAVIAVVLALCLSGVTVHARRICVLAAILGVLVFILASVIPDRLYNLSGYFSRVTPVQVLTQGASSVAAVIVELVRLGPGLYGFPPLFLACVALGVIGAPPEQRATILVFGKVYLAALVVSLFYPPREPADTFFRLWIPFMAFLTGSIAMALKTTLVLAWEYIKGHRNAPKELTLARLQESWPLVVAAIITGYILQMTVAGAEQLIVMTDHYKNRHPLKVCHTQTERLLSRSHTGDKVLYDSTNLMNCYFMRGALDLGAVYFDPVLQGTLTEKEWLMRPDLRFLVAYNPLVIHPSFQGLHERRWGLSNPDFYFSPLIKGRRHGPILHEDGIEADRFKYFDLEWGKASSPNTLTVTVENPGDSCSVLVSPVDDIGRSREDRAVSLPIPGVTVSWLYDSPLDVESSLGRGNGKKTTLTVDLAPMRDTNRLRLQFPLQGSRVRIVGLRFDHSRLNWPWEHRARLVITDKAWEIGAMNFSFDPQELLPARLRHRPVTVIDDCGSSVLAEIMPSGNALHK